MLIVAWQEAGIMAGECWKSVPSLVIEPSEGEAYRHPEDEVDILQLLQVESVRLV